MAIAVNRKWEGQWDQLIGKVKKLWSNLTENEFFRARHDYDKLVQIIEARSGQTREEIEEVLTS